MPPEASPENQRHTSNDRQLSHASRLSNHSSFVFNKVSPTFDSAPLLSIATAFTRHHCHFDRQFCCHVRHRQQPAITTSIPPEQ
jgi:hypothetical protein